MGRDSDRYRDGNRDRYSYRGKARAKIAKGTGRDDEPGTRSSRGQGQVSASRAGPPPPLPAPSTAHARGAGSTVPGGTRGAGVGGAGRGTAREDPGKPRLRFRGAPAPQGSLSALGSPRASGGPPIVLQGLLRELLTGPLGAPRGAECLRDPSVPQQSLCSSGGSPVHHNDSQWLWRTPRSSGGPQVPLGAPPAPHGDPPLPLGLSPRLRGPSAPRGSRASAPPPPHGSQGSLRASGGPGASRCCRVRGRTRPRVEPGRAWVSTHKNPQEPPQEKSKPHLWSHGCFCKGCRAARVRHNVQGAE